MSNDIKLGKLVEGDAQRDAVHVAIAPVVALEGLQPGDHIGFISGGTYRVGKVSPDLSVGIVDPYLQHRVSPGDKFYMLLHPQTVTSLRHDWTHPAFPSQLPINEQAYDKTGEQHAAEQWLRDFAEEIELPYAELIDALVNYVATGHGHTLSHDTPDACYTKAAELWKQYEALTRTEVADKEATIFSCAC